MEILIQDFADEKPKDLTGLKGSQAGATSPILEPKAADLILNGEVQTDEAFISSLIKLHYEGVTYDSPEMLPPDTQDLKFLRKAYRQALDKWVATAKKLEAQHKKKPIEIVRFDLNEFLNVSDRLRSSRPFYIEG